MADDDVTATPTGNGPDPAPATGAPVGMAGTVLTVEQDVPLRHIGGTVSVTALPTGVAGLVICPAMGVDDDVTEMNFTGHCTLTHTATGRSISHGDSRRLRRLAGRLAEFDWTFTDVDHFTDPANADTLARIQQIVRDEQTAAGGGAAIRLIGDTEEMSAARGAAPAHTLLREHLDWWLEHHAKRPKLPAGEAMLSEAGRSYMYNIMVSVEGYGVIYLMAVLHRFAPDVADTAARNLLSAWGDGDFGEWVYQWGQELTAGQPLTLYGIPTSEPLVPEHAGGLPTTPRDSGVEPTRFPTPGENFVDLNGEIRGVAAVTPRPNTMFDPFYRVEYLDGAQELYAVTRAHIEPVE